MPQDGSVDPSHTEYASLGDHFVVFSGAGDGSAPKTARDVPRSTFVCAYTPTAKAGAAHLVTISSSTAGSSASKGQGEAKETPVAGGGGNASPWAVCVGKGRGGSGAVIDTSRKVRTVARQTACLSCSQQLLRLNLYPAPSLPRRSPAMQIMVAERLSGFAVHAEPGVWSSHPGLRQTLKEDLR